MIGPIWEVRRLTIGYYKVWQAYVKLTMKRGRTVAYLFKLYTTVILYKCVTFHVLFVLTLCVPPERNIVNLRWNDDAEFGELRLYRRVIIVRAQAHVHKHTHTYKDPPACFSV